MLRQKASVASTSPFPPGMPSFPRPSRTTTSTAFCRRARARLIHKVLLVDPLTCPKCGRLRILSFIDNPGVIEKILRHLKLWDLPER